MYFILMYLIPCTTWNFPHLSCNKQWQGALLQHWRRLWTQDAVLHSVCKAMLPPFPMPASCQKKYPDNT